MSAGEAKGASCLQSETLELARTLMLTFNEHLRKVHFCAPANRSYAKTFIAERFHFYCEMPPLERPAPSTVSLKGRDDFPFASNYWTDSDPFESSSAPYRADEKVS